MQATLYLVATPIGNLSDLSPRARETLASVDFVACEDTRHTSKLLSHFDIRVPTESLHAHNEKDKAEFLVKRLLASPHKSAAFVSDAGTPGVSDPGAVFVKAARQHGVMVVAIPGPSSLSAALSVCGFLQPRQIFSGFLERSKEAQQREFARWRAVAPCVAVFFESPNRVLASLLHLRSEFGDKLEIVVSREISKIHEEHITGDIETVVNVLEKRDRIQGEFVVSVNVQETEYSQLQSRNKLTLDEAVAEVLQEINQGKRLKDAVREIAESNRLDSKTLYRLAQGKRDERLG